ncbi:DUF167 domain-containing protein [Candidatus Odyssella thessalonicensis]|uniref:DUF167 domain-containing protein n=1 Tax=Candidatus Odyssella thessalonicensis TaxID=84647 RepID=UPI000225AEC9|nr:DUF167 domain-containing protein [Candidatus Odyssella thessalonicensis]
MFYSVQGSKVVIYIRLSPKSSKDAIGGIYKDDRERRMLKISVTAPAEDNKANQALIKFLAKKLKIAPSQLTLLQGHTHRNKTVAIESNTISQIVDFFSTIS